MKGRLLQGRNNKHYALQDFFTNNNRLRCPECGCLLDPYFRSLRIDFKSKFDFSSTYEGVYIVSKRFMTYIQQAGYKNFIFYPVNMESLFFYFQVLNSVININIEKSGISYQAKCNTCNNPREITGGLDIFIEQAAPLADGFYTSNIYWRSHYIYWPEILIGEETYKKLKAQSFMGIDMANKVF